MSKVVLSVPYDNFEPDLFRDGEYSSSTVVENTINEETEVREPVDKNNWVYYGIYLLGTSSLLPWFFFLTCNDYWMYRFRGLSNNTRQLHLFFEDVHAEYNRTQLQAEFTSYISIASTIPSTIFLFFNIYYLRRFSIEWRIILSYAVILLCFIETTILVLFDSDSWQFEFFVLSLITAVTISVATAVLQAALCGIVMKFPVAYVSAFSSGQSFAGIFASIAVLLTLLSSYSPTTSTFIYFIFADITIAASFFGFQAVRRSEFYQFHVDHVTHGQTKTGSIQYQRIDSESNVSSTGPIGYGALQKKMWLSSASMFLTYLVTGMLYPSIAVLVCSVNMGRQSPWNEKYFVPVVTYLSYCIFDYIGRICAGFIQKPKGQLSIWFSVVRIIFIPLLLFCNAQPRHHLPVLIESDWIYNIIIITFAFSSGYISTLAFILLPERVLAHEQEVASTILAIWFGISISVGSVLSVPLINML